MAIIGREEPADIVVRAPQVSVEHASIELVSPGAYRLRDLGSTNGTFVNGRRVELAVVTTRDHVTLGTARLDWPLVVRALDGTAPRAVPPAAPGSVTLGRERGNDLVVPDARVSASHLRLRRVGQALEIEDLASANGTFVNGTRIGRAHVYPGDQVRLGSMDVDLIALVRASGLLQEAAVAGAGVTSVLPAMDAAARPTRRPDLAAPTPPARTPATHRQAAGPSRRSPSAWQRARARLSAAQMAVVLAAGLLLFALAVSYGLALHRRGVLETSFEHDLQSVLQARRGWSDEPTGEARAAIDRAEWQAFLAAHAAKTPALMQTRELLAGGDGMLFWFPWSRAEEAAQWSQRIAVEDRTATLLQQAAQAAASLDDAARQAIASSTQTREQAAAVLVAASDEPDFSTAAQRVVAQRKLLAAQRGILARGRGAAVATLEPAAEAFRQQILAGTDAAVAREDEAAARRGATLEEATRELVAYKRRFADSVGGSEGVVRLFDRVAGALFPAARGADAIATTVLGLIQRLDQPISSGGGGGGGLLGQIGDAFRSAASAVGGSPLEIAERVYPQAKVEVETARTVCTTVHKACTQIDDMAIAMNELRQGFDAFAEGHRRAAMLRTLNAAPHAEGALGTQVQNLDQVIAKIDEARGGIAEFRNRVGGVPVVGDVANGMANLAGELGDVFRGGRADIQHSIDELRGTEAMEKQYVEKLAQLRRQS